MWSELRKKSSPKGGGRDIPQRDLTLGEMDAEMEVHLLLTKRWGISLPPLFGLLNL